jgi:hypothetical protein
MSELSEPVQVKYNSVFSEVVSAAMAVTGKISKNTKTHNNMATIVFFITRSP